MTRFSTIINPMERSFNEWDQKRRALRQQYWAALNQARKDFGAEFGTFNGFNVYYIQRKFGFNPDVNHKGEFTDTYKVTDEKKFTLFRLQYFK